MEQAITWVFFFNGSEKHLFALVSPMIHPLILKYQYQFGVAATTTTTTARLRRVLNLFCSLFVQ